MRTARVPGQAPTGDVVHSDMPLVLVSASKDPFFRGKQTNVKTEEVRYRQRPSYVHQYYKHVVIFSPDNTQQGYVLLILIVTNRMRAYL